MISRPTILRIVLAVLLCCGQQAWAEDGIFFKRHAMHKVDASNNVYLVSAQVHFQLTPYLKQALMNGVALKVGVFFGLGEQRSWWWNKTEPLAQMSYQLKYHALSRHFLLTRNDTNENWNYRALPTALRQMGNIVNYKLPALPDSVRDGEHFIYMGVRLSPATVRLPLKIQSLFSDQYSLSSEVISWPLP